MSIKNSCVRQIYSRIVSCVYSLNICYRLDICICTYYNDESCVLSLCVLINLLHGQMFCIPKSILFSSMYVGRSVQFVKPEKILLAFNSSNGSLKCDRNSQLIYKSNGRSDLDICCFSVYGLVFLVCASILRKAQ